MQTWPELLGSSRYYPYVQRAFLNLQSQVKSRGQNEVGICLPDVDLRVES